MTIIKVAERRRNFTQVANETLRDETLSWKARGILAYLLSLPDDWEVHVTELEKHATDGIAALRSGLEELENAGYVTRETVRDTKGRFASWTMTVFERPVPEQKRTDESHPVLDFPQVDNPKMEKSNTTNTYKEKNTDKTNTKDLRKRKTRADPHSLMVKALADVSGMDMKISSNAGRIVRTSKELREAGYSHENVYRFFDYWKKSDWRWRKNGQRPALTVIKSDIGKMKPSDERSPEEAKRLAELELQKARSFKNQKGVL